MHKKLLILTLSLCISACSFSNDPYYQYGTVGGLTGMGVGVGTGALVASLIANGDLAGSALLGGAVGLPLGILAGVAYRASLEKSELEENNELIKANAEYIMARQVEIDRQREELIDNSFRIQPNIALRDEIYTGATIGWYNR